MQFWPLNIVLVIQSQNVLHHVNACIYEMNVNTRYERRQYCEKHATRFVCLHAAVQISSAPNSKTLHTNPQNSVLNIC